LHSVLQGVPPTPVLPRQVLNDYADSITDDIAQSAATTPAGRAPEATRGEQSDAATQRL
jgi:hypothetical protein